jgi:phosphatidylethanolamine-binding protein (PEBP) family uncharacterized protein
MTGSLTSAINLIAATPDKNNIQYTDLIHTLADIESVKMHACAYRTYNPPRSDRPHHYLWQLSGKRRKPAPPLAI